MMPEATPRRPASAAVVSSKRLADGKVEGMVQAAHRHLADRPHSQRRRRDNQDDAGLRSEVVRLADHMDSFPLVPLPVIPQLSIRDLEKVQRGLDELLESLSSHESDQQLGRYATRQLALVQRHLTQQRAQERVFQMLRGDVSVTLAPIAANTLKRSSSADTVKITPRSASTPTSICHQTSKVRANEAASLHWKSKKAAVEMARAMVHANAMKKTTSISTGFMISAGDNASRKRRRPRVVKRTPEEEAKYKAQQLERERENRRQAAYQRLQARRELQAKKKQEHKKQKKDEDTDSRCTGDVCGKQEVDSGSDDESEASDVSNCSESDEANEKAILALEVQIESSVGEVESSPRTDRSGDSDGDASKDVEENCSLQKDKDEDLEAPECHSSRSTIPDQVPENSTTVIENFETSSKDIVSSIDSTFKDVEGTDEFKNVSLQEAEKSKATFEAKMEQPQCENETTVFDLQSFMASRAAAKLEQLRAEKQAREKVTRRLRFLQPLTFVQDLLRSTVCVSRSEASDDKEATKRFDKSQANTPTKPSTLVMIEQLTSHLGGQALTLPRTPVAECKDYRFYFRNFHCILTSVFEQCRGNSPTSSTSSLYHRPIGATGEHTMRLQQKLYESWQSIMQDYATVFGPRIVAPEGMVPIAAAKPWAPHYRINSIARKEVAEIVTQALLRLGGGWEDHPSGLGLKTTWNLLWTWSKPRVERQTLLVWQKVNHFQHAKALTRKDCLKKHIGKYLSAGGKLRQAFDIIPPTFLLPKEYVSFVQAFQERSERLRRNGVSEAKNIWIMKPVALSRGRGISLVNDLSQVIYGEQVIIQEYIAAPRLLDGFKFDLRLYVLVTSFNPLEAFLYDEGFVRLCTRPYEDSDISNIFVHLTNSSIQKENQEAITGTCTMNEEKSEASQKDTGGTKTTLAYLWRRLAAEGVDVEQVKRSIEEVVLKALLCGEDHIPLQVNSFDLLGYDILLDADLRPWLIEINSSPSMARDIDLDYQVKDAMMLDTLRVVDPLHFDRAKLAEVIARRQRDQEEEKRRPHAHTRHPRETEELAARQLNEDLTAILRGKVPRAYGEMPEDIGNYRRLCPHTNIYNQLVKLKRSCLRAKA
ncbi:Tubulin-tyrosine ligase family [Phytophthora infestans]|uniref:Tubulin-tyrosine ligase family n=1 Tax=Phytophthora infestans TaxID=4787 RepID=A0A833T453_PHYIN|nr:Tubulin-tyrosine ligase family [Phytophthora infestans]